MEQFAFNSAFEHMMEKDHLTTVVILAHINPDGDAAGSVMSLAHYIRSNYSKVRVLPYLSEKLDKGPKQKVLKDGIFHPFEMPEPGEDPYAVIVCDTATMERIAGKELYDGATASLVLDHHASNEGYGDVNYTKISESCSENIFYMLDRGCLEQAAAYKDKDCPGHTETCEPEKCMRHTATSHNGWGAAEYIYLGMVHDTDGFDRADAGTLEAAASLLHMGVNHKELLKTLKTETFDDVTKRTALLTSAVRVMDGKVAYVYVDRQESMQKDIRYEDIHPISGRLRDCEDIELGMTFYEEEEGLWRCSFRSDGQWINVNELLNPFHGGGHAGAAGLRTKTDQPKQLVQDILERVNLLRKNKD